jgi:hypothetical protein
VKPVIATAACAAVIATGVAACGSSQGPNPSHAQKQSAPPQAQAQAQLPAQPAAPGVIGPALPKISAAPNVVKAQAAVEAALRDVDAAAAAVFAKGSPSSIASATSVLSRHLAVIQKQTTLAWTAGQAGRCGDSFKASRAANALVKPTRGDLTSLSRLVGDVHRARSHYAHVRLQAMAALQTLYNAIAGHPLSTGPSAFVDQLRAAIQGNDGATAQTVTDAVAALNAAHASLISAKQAVAEAAQAPCMDVGA